MRTIQIYKGLDIPISGNPEYKNKRTYMYSFQIAHIPFEIFEVIYRSHIRTGNLAHLLADADESIVKDITFYTDVFSI